MSTAPVNRLRELVAGNACVCESHPGTPDDRVPHYRLQGRLAFRGGARFSHSRELPVAEGGRVQFWNGYFDEQIGYLFGRGAKPL